MEHRPAPIPGPRFPRPPHPALPAAARLARRLGLVVVLVGLVLLLHRPALRAYAGLFNVDEPVKSDLIVLLLGGPDHRPARVGQLYKEGIAPKVVFCTSGEVVSEFTGETEVTSRMLAKHGVPKDAQITLPDKVTSTKDEAEAVRRYLTEHPASQILVVTSDFHTRRARWIFRRTLKDLNVTVNAAAAVPLYQDGAEWYMKDESLIMYFIETVKMLVYWVRY